MGGGARHVRWGTASPPQPGLYLAAGHTRHKKAMKTAAIEVAKVWVSFGSPLPTDHQLKPPALGIRGGLASFGEPRLGAENHTAARSPQRLAS